MRSYITLHGDRRTLDGDNLYLKLGYSSQNKLRRVAPSARLDLAYYAMIYRSPLKKRVFSESWMRSQRVPRISPASPQRVPRKFSETPQRVSRESPEIRESPETRDCLYNRVILTDQQIASSVFFFFSALDDRLGCVDNQARICSSV